MLKKLFLVFAIIALVNWIENPAVIANPTKSPNTSKYKPFECGSNGLLTPAASIMAEVKSCPAGPCEYFCQAELLDLLSEDGLPSPAKYNSFVDGSIPKQYSEFSKEFFGDCLQKFGQYIDKADPTCAKVNEFTKCTWNIIPHLKCTPS